MKYFGKGLYWTLLIIIFGLSQLWYIIGKNIFITNYNFDLFLITKDGVLLFFILALTTSLTLDFWLDLTHNRISLSQITAFVFYPLLITILVVSLYSYTFTFSKEIDKEMIKSANVILIISSLIYSLVVKSYLFYRGDLQRGGKN